MKRENWFGFACRLAIAVWSAYWSWQMFKSLDSVVRVLSGGDSLFAPVGVEAASPALRMLRLVIVFHAGKWAPIAGCIFAARWALGFSDWPTLRRSKVTPSQ